MSLKRKTAVNGRGSSSDDDEASSDFDVSLLDDELSSEDELDIGEDDAHSGSGENTDQDDDDDESTESTESKANRKMGSVDGAESENLLSDASSEYDTEDPDIVLDAEGNPRKLLPEIDPHYDSDSSTGEEINTIGNIDIEKYYPASMPHIGYDINGRRIMRPAAGAALDQLLETIDLPKGWTGIIDKETGGLKNLTDEELEIIKRIRKEELPNDKIDVYDVSILKRRKANLSHIAFLWRTHSHYRLHQNLNAVSSHLSMKQFEL